MKKLFFILALAGFISIDGYSQGQRKSPHDTLSFANGNITYGRPYKKGREIFGSLEKYGVVWRLGADEATTITFNSDTKFGDKKIPKGTYTMFALPEEKEWTIILNSQLGQWGAFGYEDNKDKDVAAIKVPVKKLGSPVEQLTIHFDKSNNMVIEWDTTQVSVPVSF